MRAGQTLLAAASLPVPLADEPAARPARAHGRSVSAYVMSPAEDVILFGDELGNGMWVLADDCGARPPYGAAEEDRLRAQRFRRVTRLRREGDLVTFVGEWLDGYQALHQASASSGWIVKRDSLLAREAS